MRPPLKGKRDAARRFVDGVRRSVAEAVAPPPRERLDEPGGELRDAHPVDSSDARFDAARERLKSSVAPRDEDDGQPTHEKRRGEDR